MNVKSCLALMSLSLILGKYECYACYAYLVSITIQEHIPTKTTLEHHVSHFPHLFSYFLEKVLQQKVKFPTSNLCLPTSREEKIN